MALWVCRRCTTRFAVGLSMCPQCTSTDVTTEEDYMPKTTSSGPSHAGVTHDIEGDQSSAGTSSSTPTDSPQTPASEETSSKRKSAQTTENPSKKDPTESSTARSTATSRTTKSDKEGK